MLDKDTYQAILNELSWLINRGNIKIGCGCKYNSMYLLRVINQERIVHVRIMKTSGVKKALEQTNEKLWHSNQENN